MKTGILGRIWRAVVSPSFLPVTVAAVVVGLLGLYADYENRILYERSLRAEVLAKINLMRARAENHLELNQKILGGLAAVIATDPTVRQPQFQDLAKRALGGESQLRAIAAAPDFVLSMVYINPESGAAISGRQWATVLEVRDTGQPTISSPIDLPDGGIGIVSRIPIYVDGPRERRFWGLLSGVVDVNRLFFDSGVFDSRDIRIAIFQHRANDSNGYKLFGSKDIEKERPVRATITLPAGSWVISAVPVQGWSRTPDEAWLFRAMIIFAGCLVVFPIALAGRFYNQRQRNYLALQRNESELRGLSQRLELALKASRLGVWEQDITTGIVEWDDRLDEIYGLERPPADRIYDDWIAFLHPDDRRHAEADYLRGIASRSTYTSNYRVVRPNGEIRHIRTHGTFVDDPQKGPRVIGAEWDRTEDVLLNQALEQAKVLAETRSAELEATKARIEHNALHDSLTQLPNRRYLDAELSKRLSGEMSNAGRIALLHVDLDRFKQINDTLGHAAGDAMLMHVAKVLREATRKEDFVARIGGDEFVAVCRVDNDRNLAELADRIVTEMVRPVSYEGHQCRFGVSIGIAMQSAIGVTDPGELLVNADIALYRAKSQGRNRYEFFTKALQSDIVRTKKLADDILVGLERNQFLVYYQPQFDARTLEIAGVEALVRWAHPTEGLLTPAAFLSTAEDLNVVSSIDKLVLEHGLADFERWNAMGLDVPHLSVNVSARRLRDRNLIESLSHLKIRAGTLSFELLESTFLDDTDEIVAWNIDRIKDLGIDVEIDDFGTGYASIVSLMKLQPRRLKIDRQLIQPIVKSVRQRHLVASIIEIGKTLGIDTVAEGVETMVHARILKKLGCDKLQGYTFGQPLSAEALENYIRARAWRAAS